MAIISGALAILLIAGASAFVLLRARRLRARHQAVLAQALPLLDEGGAALIEAKAALFHGTRFADGEPFLSPLWGEACVGDLWCTKEALFLRREQDGSGAGRVLAWPVAWMEEAVLVRGFAALAGKDLPMMRLRFVRGGTSLVSDFSLKGGMASLERLRRQLHLMAAPQATLVQLGKFIDEGARLEGAEGKKPGGPEGAG